jgi:DNA-directed RNA polymerase specialized sigma24 family protein
MLAQTLETIRGEIEPRTWQAFSLLMLEGQPPDEVAGQLGISAGALRQIKYRILRRLRQELGDAE